EGPVYQAGTLSGNPLAMAAGVATLRVLYRKGVFDSILKKAEALEEGLRDAAKKARTKVKFYRAGTMFCTYFTDKEVYDYQSAKRADTEKFARFFHEMLSRGVYIAPSQFEAGFMSLAHTDKDIERTVEAAYEALRVV
ncbi:MAG: aminotransferase class III-fold pyridoxal phosphate-dependent enzyme, partial [Nitrospirae bacterium]